MSLQSEADAALLEIIDDLGETVQWNPVELGSSFEVAAYVSPNTAFDQVIAGGFATNANFNVIIRKSAITEATAVFTPQNGDTITDSAGNIYEVVSVNTSSIAPFYRLACAGPEQAK